jgi:sugar O-acyltransferase (sialic acid O-acetyltransferase NeuD family)
VRLAMQPCLNSQVQTVIDPGVNGLVVIGAGGHAKVVIDTAERAGWKIIGVIDDRPDATVFGYAYLGSPLEVSFNSGWRVVIAIGSNVLRAKIAGSLEGRVSWATVIDPHANVSRRATVLAGSVVFAGAVIQADAVIGSHCIVNSAASVDHDVTLEAFCHAGPRSVLTGAVQLEEGVFIGAGAVMIPSIRAGAWSTLGAGAVATVDLEPNGVYVGVPARKIR